MSRSSQSRAGWSSYMVKSSKFAQCIRRAEVKHCISNYLIRQVDHAGKLRIPAARVPTTGWVCNGSEGPPHIRIGSQTMQFEQPAGLNRYVDPSIPLTWAVRWRLAKPTLPMLVFCSVIVVEQAACPHSPGDRDWACACSDDHSSQVSPTQVVSEDDNNILGRFPAAGVQKRISRSRMSNHCPGVTGCLPFSLSGPIVLCFEPSIAV